MKWWVLSLEFCLPHNKFLIGWTIDYPDDDVEYYSASIYLGLINLHFDWIN